MNDVTRDVDLPVVAQPSPMSMLQIAVQRGASIDELTKLMDLQERFEKNEAMKAFNSAFAAFKSEAIVLIRNVEVKDGPLKGKKYADKFATVDAVTAHLSTHGLSSSWRITRDEKDWIEITCVLRHVQGHSESTSMGGGPDIGPGRNAIQARSSTISYLEKLTLKAICGIAERGDDDDGQGAGRTQGNADAPKREPVQQPQAKKDVLPQYPADKFESNFGKYTDTIVAGKKTAEQVIGIIESKYVLSAEQKKEIRALQPKGPA